MHFHRFYFILLNVFALVFCTQEILIKRCCEIIKWCDASPRVIILNHINCPINWNVYVKLGFVWNIFGEFMNFDVRIERQEREIGEKIK